MSYAAGQASDALHLLLIEEVALQRFAGGDLAEDHHVHAGLDGAGSLVFDLDLVLGLVLQTELATIVGTLRFVLCLN